MNYWLMKSEPDTYSWSKLVTEKRGRWDGVRNPIAARNLKRMKVGDKVFFYHSNIGKEIVGVMEVVREHYPDPSDDTGKWVAVDVKPDKPVKTPVTLAAVKAEPRLAEMALARYARLSVQPVTPEEWKLVCRMAGLGA
ncbi:MAG TPA: EVE domain-containing protein [Alphaproteobacteria bacterium]